MNQSRAFLTSLIFAILAMFLVYFYVQERESEISLEYGTKVTVVVAKRNIYELEEIRRDALRTRVLPKAFLQPDTEEDPATFEGTVALAPIREGEQLQKTKVLIKGSETGLAFQVGINYRAFSIPVSEVTGVNKLIKPGDRVDIVSNVSYQTGSGQESEIKTLAQNINVLAVGELVQNSIPQAFENDPISGTKRAMNLRGNRNFSTITVEVSPLEAQQLIFILQSGAELFLTLRNPVDRVVSSIPTTTVDEVLGPNSRKAQRERARESANAPVPKVRRPPPPSSPFIQGGSSLAK